MYQPAHFREDRLDIQHDLIRSHPLGLLVCVSARGLEANPIPFVLDSGASQLGTLTCHVARPNPVWGDLASADECLVVFQGAQSYVTPSWYPAKRETDRVVPTWNYATVHAWGRPRVIHDVDWIRAQVEALTGQQERMMQQPWSVSDAPEPYIAAQLRAIVGIEIEITRIEGKWKVSQNRNEADRAGVAEGLLAGSDAAREMSALVMSRRDRNITDN